jgi:hypothetical protein
MDMLPDMADFGEFLAELRVDEELIRRIQRDLVEISQQIDDTGFRTFVVDQSVYGDAQVGWSLGYHHSLAHQKVARSLTAVLEDLRTFRDGFTTFRTKVEDADTGSAADSRTVQAATDALFKSAGFSHTHQVNHHYHPGGGTDA